MFLNYGVYLSTLSIEQKEINLFIVLTFFIILLAICGILTFIKYKFFKLNNNSLHKKFLKRFQKITLYLKKKHTSYKSK